MNNTVYSKTMKKLRNRIYKTCKQQKRLFKMDIKIKLYVKNIFENNLVAIRKNKVTLLFNWSVYLGMCILEMSKAVMYELYYDYIKINMATIQG